MSKLDTSKIDMSKIDTSRIDTGKIPEKSGDLGKAAVDATEAQVRRDLVGAAGPKIVTLEALLDNEKPLDIERAHVIAKKEKAAKSTPKKAAKPQKKKTRAKARRRSK